MRATDPTGRAGTGRVPGEGNTPRDYSYLLPLGYDEHPAARWPVLFMLHGLTGSHTDWLSHTRLARHAAPYPFVLVMPDADDSYYTDAYDGRCGYETYFVEELLPHVDRAFRTAANREGRGLIGLSMGGFGALKLALRHPDLFAAAASHSAGFARVREETPPGQPHPVFGDSREHAALRRANDPFVLAEAAAADPLRPALFLDCGLQDPLIEGSRAFHAHLERLGIPHEYAERPGHHTWPYWNRAVKLSLAFMASWLRASSPGS